MIEEEKAQGAIFIKTLNEYNANLVELLRKERAEKRSMRHQYERIVQGFEDELRC